MSTKIFVNLPVKNLEKSKAFFTSLGYQFNPQFTDDKAGCLVISEAIFAMLLTEPFFKTFIPGEISDTSAGTESITCLSADSRQHVDEIISKAIAAGGTTYNEPQDHGFMYGHGFRDLDGHLWEYMWMDPAAINSGS